jgi:hypothetical protein
MIVYIYASVDSVLLESSAADQQSSESEVQLVVKKLPIGKSKRGAVLIYPSPKRFAGHRRPKAAKGLEKVTSPTKISQKSPSGHQSTIVAQEVVLNSHNLHTSSGEESELRSAHIEKQTGKDAENVEVFNANDAADLTLTKSWIDDSVSEQCPGLALAHDDVAKVYEVNTSVLKQPPGPDLKPKKSSLRDGSRSTSSRSDHVSFKESVDVLPISPKGEKNTRSPDALDK